jgi:pimeloyl-ACP methyl ester carboxylesterase
MRRLAGQTVFALDLPAHGESPGPALASVPTLSAAIAAWIDSLMLPRVILAGHSLGGAIALQLALDFPQVVHSLVLFGGGARLPVNPLLLQEASDLSTLTQAIQHIVRWSFGPAVPLKVITQVQRRMLDLPAGVLLADLSACGSFDVRLRLGELRQPLLALTGERDKMTPPSLANEMCTSLSNAHLQIIPHAGHMLMLEAEAEVARTLAGFVHGLGG